MTIEELEKLATTFYLESADSFPESTTANKDDLMAHTIEHAIEHKTPLLERLKKAENHQEVYNILNRWYEDSTMDADFPRDAYQ